jgi:rhodanese-related sulfurtransferase
VAQTATSAVSSAKPAAEAKDVTPAEAEKLLKEKRDIVVLDVRTPEEFAGGHIAGAKNIDYSNGDFAKKVGELDKSKDYLIHCAAGGRSAKALNLMKDQKFSGAVYHMDGGFNAWKQAGKPVEK